MTKDPGPRLLVCRLENGTAIVTLDNGEILEVAAGALPGDLPRVGEPLSPDLLGCLRDAAERKRIARRVFQLLDRRLYPMAALRRLLSGEGHAQDAVAAVLDEFAAKDLHSDRRYAEAYCRDTLRRRPVGRRYLLAKLREQQVVADAAETAVAATLPAEREEELAREAGQRRWARERDPGDPAAMARVQRFLAGRGFNPGMASRVARATAPPHRQEDAE
jgi:SOS response regulatory protein OraA/RecX